jgi:hypothetical protein
MNTWQIHGGIEEVRDARALVSQSMRDQSEVSRDAAVLLVDECVANAVQHGGGVFDLIVQRGPECLRVEVVDKSPELPVQLVGGAETARGWGLNLVDSLAARWGADLLDHGKVVWFEVSLD